MGYTNEFADNEFRSAGDRPLKAQKTLQSNPLRFTYVPLRSEKVVHIENIEVLSDATLSHLLMTFDLFFGTDPEMAPLRAAVEGEMIERGLL